MDARRVEALCQQSAAKIAALRADVRACESVLVAFSAGVDSTFVLKIAVEELGDRAIALTSISASMAPEEQDEAKALAEKLNARWVPVRSEELANPEYTANPTNRCYFCKTELYDLCVQKKQELGVAAILDGFNADDFKDHRPGHQAAKEHAVRSPLASAGLTKNEIRAWSHRLGLPTWDKPQMACLASRIPYGTAVTGDRLMQIGAGESALRQAGFKSFRLRYHGEIARIEIAAEEQARIYDPAIRKHVDAALKAVGFKFVAVDLEPFRSGRMNDAIGMQLPVLS
ncbi:MAG: ATP-dependent sacrificial sulfur transferase LarE [Myxococcaceae bacterium]